MRETKQGSNGSSQTEKNMKTSKLSITWSRNGMYCSEVFNNPALALEAKRAIANQYIASDDYAFAKRACAFLQCNTPDYILIEYWTNDLERIQPFIDYINSKL